MRGNGPHGKRRGPAWRLPCCYGLAYPLPKPLADAVLTIFLPNYLVWSNVCLYIWAINEQRNAMKSQMHPERIAALEAYRAAIRATASAQTEEECAMLIIAEDAAMRHSVAMDAKYPTDAEMKRRSNRQYLNSIGLWNW